MAHWAHEGFWSKQDKSGEHLELAQLRVQSKASQISGIQEPIKRHLAHLQVN